LQITKERTYEPALNRIHLNLDLI